MPYRKSSFNRRRRNRRRTKRRTYGKKFRKTTRTLTRGMYSPDEYYCAMKYSDMLTLTSTSGAVVEYVFRGMSAYDPDYTSTGGQPTGFDQVGAMYDKYQVMGCSIVLRAIGVTATVPGRLCLNINNNPAAFGSYLNALQQPRTLSKMVVPLDSPSYLKSYVQPWTVIGIPKMQYKSDDIYSAATTASPSATFQPYIHLLYQSVDGSTTTVSFVEVVVKYYVRFFARKSIGTS